MQPDTLTTNAELRLEHTVHHLLGDLVWVAVALIVPLFFFYFFRTTIQCWIDGWRFHRARKFDLDDEIIVNDKLCRLVRYNRYDTTFYEYVVDKETDIIVSADRWTVPNDKLKDLKITRQIRNHQRPTNIKPVG